MREDFALGFVRRVAHADPHQEAIELRFRERIGAVMLDRILRGNHEKRIGQRERFAVDGDLRFIHGFEQCGLRARRGGGLFRRLARHWQRLARSETRIRGIPDCRH